MKKILSIIKKILLNEYLKKIKRSNRRAFLAKDFPVSNEKNYFFESLDINKYQFNMKFYLEKDINQLRTDFTFFRGEILKSVPLAEGETHTLAVTQPLVLPVCLESRNPFSQMDADNNVSVTIDGVSTNLKGLVAERFYHLRLDRPTQIQLRSNRNALIGSPLPLTNSVVTRYRLVLLIYIDSWSWELAHYIDMEREFPNIFKFFSKGTVFENCYGWGSWTLPSAGCIFTGLHVRRHGLFDPKRNDTLTSEYPLISEMFQNAGYMTFQSCGNWRKTPNYGYARGFDRTVFKNQMGSEEVIAPLIDHLRAFPERSHFAFMSLNDAHHAMRLTREISVQVRLPLGAHEKDPKSGLDGSASSLKRRCYVEELRKIDFNLGMMFEHLKTLYKEDEMLICLTADHGVNYLYDNDRILAREKTHVPLMIAGGGVPSQHSGELVQNLDILPILGHFSGIRVAQGLDGRLPESLGGPPAREAVLSEVLYPGRPYIVSVKDRDYDLTITSRASVAENGTVAAEGAAAELFKGNDYLDDLSQANPGIKDRLEGILKKMLPVSADLL